jgi:glycosyltransferase involved in cell wall biosynthesis
VTPRVSIIIPAYNEEYLLEATLRAVGDGIAAIGVPAEVIVVDDGSTDRTAGIARDQGARVVSVNLRHIAAARNAGARAAGGSVLMFVDADTIVPAPIFKAALAAIDAGAVGGGAGVRQDTPEPRWGAFAFVVVSWILRTAGWAAGCFVFVRRDVFDRVHGFDEQFFASEEIHLSRAVKRQGRFVILKESVITSGRKARMFSGRAALIQFAAALWPGTLKRRDRLRFWYGGEREKPQT